MRAPNTAIKYLFFSWFVLSFAFSHLLLSHVIKKGEVYPFFKWNLFSEPSVTLNDYEIRIDSWEGKKLDSPCFLRECPFIETKTVKDTGAYGLIQEFASAFTHSSPDTAALKKDLDFYLLRSRPCEYTLLQRNYKALDVVQKNAAPEYIHISEFSAGMM
jgi:hypothetical protein